MLFEIYFKINLVVPLGFKVINVKKLAFEKSLKNLKRKFKYYNVNIFQLIKFCNGRIPN